MAGEAIPYEDDVPTLWAAFTDGNARFCPLQGRGRPVGSPGGASKIGRLGVDTDLSADTYPVST